MKPNVEQFLEGACCWDLLAPLQLRSLELESRSLEWNTYSTASLTSKERPIILFSTGPYGSGSVRIETLSEITCMRWRDCSFRFASRPDIQYINLYETMFSVFEMISVVPQLLSTVVGLCRSLHVILSRDIDLDISFSEPALPFSMFVSVPCSSGHYPVERLVESVIHEALHLQLSIVERVVPLTDDHRADERIFSPWKETMRGISGVLHSVYVFKNLHSFWSRLANSNYGSSEFALKRILKIEEELKIVEKILRLQCLTPYGQRIVQL